MNIKIKVTETNSVPWEKVQNVIINVVKAAMEESDGLKTGISVTECIRTLDGAVVGWVELITE